MVVYFGGFHQIIQGHNMLLSHFGFVWAVLVLFCLGIGCTVLLWPLFLSLFRPFLASCGVDVNKNFRFEKIKLVSL